MTLYAQNPATADPPTLKQFAVSYMQTYAPAGWQLAVVELWLQAQLDGRDYATTRTVSTELSAVP